MPESFDEVAGRRPQALLLKHSCTGRNFQNFEELFLVEQLWTTASGYIRILTGKMFRTLTARTNY